MIAVVLVALGGALGSIGRFLVTRVVQRRSRSGFPWGTYVVNATGTFAIGLAFGIVDNTGVPGDVSTFVASGLLGGYTTFSTYSVESFHLLRERKFGAFLHNSLGQVVVGITVAFVGYWIAATVILGG